MDGFSKKEEKHDLNLGNSFTEIKTKSSNLSTPNKSPANEKLRVVKPRSF